MDAALYEELWQVERAHWWFQARRQIVWSLIKRYIHGASRRRLQICELGCGTGGNLVELAARHDVTGVECAPQAIEYARRRLGNRVLSGRLPDQISLPTGRFDVVLLTDVLEHIEDDARSAKTALRLLRPGGIVVATVPAYQWLYSPRDAHHHHFRRYGKMQFRRLWAAAEAELLLLSYYNTYLFPAAAGVRLMSKLLLRNSEPRDLAIPPRPVNGLLARLMTSEANLLGRLPMPFGLSLIAVVRKRAVAGELRFAA
jgi:2-polyprenyl-3-methyl-5-hydroxy-6-metoxy-1,4-benzoquinol methylase